MVRVRTASAVALLLLLLFGGPGTAAAQGAAADSAPPPLTGSLDLGLVAASGNTDILTFSFGEKLEYAKGKWTVTQVAKMVNSETDGKETANEYAVYGKGAYTLTTRWKGYVLGGWDRNPFLGISQRFQEGLGLSFAALDTPKSQLTIDAGFSFFQQEFTSGISSSFPTARGQASYKYVFAPKACLQETFVSLPNLEDGNDYRVNNEVALVAPVAGWLALKASYILQYQNAP